MHLDIYYVQMHNKNNKIMYLEKIKTIINLKQWEYHVMI
jgi:hypothetical protein